MNVQENMCDKKPTTYYSSSVIDQNISKLLPVDSVPTILKQQIS